MKTTIRQLGCALLILASGAALAAEPEQCRTVRLGTVNWTDVVASSAVAEAVLDGLGYKVKQTSASQQIILDKIELNERKYPVDKARGSARKYTEL